MVDYSKENRCSLKGIIDFEIAKKKNKKEFYIPVFYSKPTRFFASVDALFNSDYYKESLQIVEDTKAYIKLNENYKNVSVLNIKTMSVKFNFKTGFFNTSAFLIKLEK